MGPIRNSLKRLDSIQSRLNSDIERVRNLNQVLAESKAWQEFENCARSTEAGQIKDAREEIANQAVVMAVSCLDVAIKDIRTTLLTAYLLLEYKPEKFHLTVPASVARIAVEEVEESGEFRGFGQGFVLAEEKLRRERARENFQGWKGIIDGLKEVGIDLKTLLEHEEAVSEIDSILGAPPTSPSETVKKLRERITLVVERRHEVVHRLGYGSAQLLDRQTPLPFEVVDQFLMIVRVLVSATIKEAKRFIAH